MTTAPSPRLVPPHALATQIRTACERRRHRHRHRPSPHPHLHATRTTRTTTTRLALALSLSLIFTHDAMRTTTTSHRPHLRRPSLHTRRHRLALALPSHATTTTPRHRPRRVLTHLRVIPPHVTAAVAPHPRLFLTRLVLTHHHRPSTRNNDDASPSPTPRPSTLDGDSTSESPSPRPSTRDDDHGASPSSRPHPVPHMQQRRRLALALAVSSPTSSFHVQWRRRLVSASSSPDHGAWPSSRPHSPPPSLHTQRRRRSPLSHPHPPRPSLHKRR